MATSQTAILNVLAQVSAVKDGRLTTALIEKARNFASGTSADQADKAYYANLTIVDSSTPQNLDFAGGGLIDLNGDAITWVEMVGLVIKNGDTGVSVVVGGHANPLNFGAGANTISLVIGEPKVLIDTGANPGYVITAGSADAIKLAIASGTNQTVEILAIGRSA